MRVLWAVCGLSALVCFGDVGVSSYLNHRQQHLIVHPNLPRRLKMPSGYILKGFRHGYDGHYIKYSTSHGVSSYAKDERHFLALGGTTPNWCMCNSPSKIDDMGFSDYVGGDDIDDPSHGIWKDNVTGQQISSVLIYSADETTSPTG